MTHAQALRKAKRRWGKDGAAWPPETQGRYVVATVELVGEELHYIIKGQSEQGWEDAFADADRRERGLP
jgi:hypothetical protein